MRCHGRSHRDMLIRIQYDRSSSRLRHIIPSTPKATTSNKTLANDRFRNILRFLCTDPLRFASSPITYDKVSEVFTYLMSCGLLAKQSPCLVRDVGVVKVLLGLSQQLPQFERCWSLKQQQIFAHLGGSACAIRKWQVAPAKRSDTGV